MNKEEKIKEAYGIYYSEKVDENGWSRVFIDSDKDLIKYFLENKTLFESKSVDFNTFIRPKSLSGIENNNGWTKIESEADLPKESWSYWIMQSDNIISTLKDYWENKKYWNITATHYQPIKKPEQPIY